MKHLFFLSILLSVLMTQACRQNPQTTAETDTITASDNKNEPPSTFDFQVIPNLSTVTWSGSKPTGTHDGTVPIASGGINISNDNIATGKIVLDMTQLKVLNPPGDMGKSLEEHLKGTAPGKEEDFFNVGKFSTATYEITSVSALSNDPDATHTFNGNLTIKDITKPVSFKARVEKLEKGYVVTAKPFNVDRTAYDIRFQSKKFFDNLKDDYIDDNFQIGFYIVAQKAG